MKTKEFVCNWSNMVRNDKLSKNIENYMKRALERGDAIYFYAIEPLYDIKDIDKMAWIKDIKHEEYDMISIQWSSGRKVYYKSNLKSDMVIKLDLTDKDVKKVFDDKFRIGTNSARSVGKGEPLFDEDPGYELRNFVVTCNDEIIMNAILHGFFDILISKMIVEEVDEE